MYSVADYGALIADKVRMGAFVAALKQTVTPDSVVVDIGTGTGIFALIACALGARRVYAIEPNDVIDLAREIAAANGYTGRIEFHQALSTDVTLPERADVMVADIGGMLPWFEGAITSLADARRRMLAPDAVIIPRRDAIWTAVVEADDLYARQTAGWTGNEFAIDMKAARDIVVNTWTRSHIGREQLLAPPERWTVVDYATLEETNVRTTMEWTVARTGTGHGFAAGFDRTVIDGVEISNAPDRPDQMRPTLVYAPVVFPWTQPVALEPGDLVSADLSAMLIGERYVWSWKTRVRSARTGEMKAAFDQSTLLSLPLSIETLKKRAR